MGIRRTALVTLAALTLTCGAAAAEDAESGSTTSGRDVSAERSVSPVFEPQRRIWWFDGRRRSPGPDTENRGRDSLIDDATQPSEADGRSCWPHGDHFHCR
jgi:hypothetical protein